MPDKTRPFWVTDDLDKGRTDTLGIEPDDNHEEEIDDTVGEDETEEDAIEEADFHSDTQEIVDTLLNALKLADEVAKLKMTDW